MSRLIALAAGLLACSSPKPNFADGAPARDAPAVPCEDEGYAECDGDELERCETYAWADEAHCGSCRTGCDADRLCVAAACRVPDVAQAALGAGHSCVRTTSGHVLCWGHNNQGQLGDGRYDDVAFAYDRADAVAVLGLDDATAIDLGGYTSCAIRGAEGAVECWGENRPAHFGPSSDAAPLYVRPEPLLGASEQVREVSVAGSHVCVLTQTEVLCAGNNFTGALGRADPNVRTTVLGPMEGLPPAETPRSLTTGGAGHTCVAMSNGRVYCAGACDWGQCGQTDAPNVFTTEEVAGLTNIVSVAAGPTFTCALDDAGAVWCWGSNTSGELGNGSVGGSTGTPARVVGLPPVHSIAAGNDFVLAVTERRDEVWGWGEAGSGQLGRGASMLSDTGTPVRILGAASVTYDIAAGGSHACILEHEGSAARLLCAGSNQHSALGGWTESSATTYEPVLAIP